MSENESFETKEKRPKKSFFSLRNKKTKSNFASTIKRTVSRLRMKKNESAPDLSESSLKEHSVDDLGTKLVKNDTLRSTQPSLKPLKRKKTKARIRYEGDKVVDTENINVEERMKHLLAAKAKRRKSIYDTPLDDDSEDKSRRSTQISNYKSEIEDGRKQKKLGLLNASFTQSRRTINSIGLTIGRRKKSNQSFSRTVARRKKPKGSLIEKTKEDVELIRSALKNNMYFSALGEEEIELLVDCLEERDIPIGENLMDDEGNGDEFFIVKKGKVSATKYANTGETKVIEEGESFGELALIHNDHQALSVQALDTVILFTICRRTYRKIIAYSEEERLYKIKRVLSSVPLLQSLTKKQVESIVQCVQLVRFKEGDPIIVKGDVGQVFYMIRTGTVECTKIGKEEDGLKDIILKRNDYFGERALLLDEPRAANVVALEDVECLALDRGSFHLHLGSLTELMNNNLVLRTLKTVPLLNNLSEKKLMKMLRSMEEEEFLPGHQILEQGVKNKKLYIIIKGEVELKVFDSSDRQKHTTVGTLKKGEYFGESAFKSSSVANTEVFAIDTVVCQSIEVRKHLKLIKPIAKTLKRQNNERIKQVLEAVKKTSEALEDNDQIIHLKDLTQMKTLGTGTFGRVKLVLHEKTGNTYALKILQKSFVKQYKQQKNVMNEKMVMMKCQHPFILKLEKTFMSQNCLYFLLEYIQGGELFSLLQSSGGFLKPNYAKFYTACVVEGITFLHKRKIVYRDLKPENLMIDAEGYIRIVDYGFAKKVENKTYTLCGTPEYLAPETVQLTGHNRAVDYWAIGVLIYEMLLGFSPFSDVEESSQEKMFKKIIRGNFAFPHKFPRHARMLVRKLMEKNPQERLGMYKEGPDEIKDARWFHDIDFALLLKKEVRAPWIPKISSATDTRHFDYFPEDNEEKTYSGSNKYWKHF